MSCARTGLERLSGAIDRFTAAIGWASIGCIALMVSVQFVVVALRYVAGLGSIWLQETIVYAHACAILLAAAWTLQVGGHVRVDIFYAGAAPRTKAIIDLCGGLLLLIPFAAMLMWLSWPYVARSWATFERSREASGLPFVFLLKTLIPVFALLMGLQGVSQVLKAIALLVGRRAARPAA